jgi:hypothetical protein
VVGAGLVCWFALSRDAPLSFSTGQWRLMQAPEFCTAAHHMMDRKDSSALMIKLSNSKVGLVDDRDVYGLGCDFITAFVAGFGPFRGPISLATGWDRRA